MKKFFVSLGVVLGCITLTGCGFGTTGMMQNQAPANAQYGNGMASGMGSNQLGGSSSTANLISNIISTFASGITTNQSTIIGTWNYNRPCVQFESESLLAKAGGSLIATNVEGKLDSYYKMVGIQPGACKFVLGRDNTMQYTIGGRTMTGTYTYDSTKRTITFKTQLGAKITAYVSVSVNAMALTFDASKFLTLVNTASSLSQNLSTISSLASNYNGMKIGFTFTR